MKPLKNNKLREPDKLALLIEKAKRERALANSKPLILHDDFLPQNDFVNDPDRFLAAQCSRRAGKSNALALKFFKTMEKYPGEQCVYLALTRESAYNIMWPVLQEHNETNKIGCSFIESKLTMVHPNGAKLRLLGADSKNFIKRIKGIRSPGIAIDEAQDFGPHLKSLVDDVLTPTLANFTDGWLAVTGTPGPVPNGYFFEVSQEGKYGYSVHKWTILENPYIPQAREFIEEVKTKQGWDDNNPTLLREWRNNWVLDTNSLWVKYKESVNHFQTLPPITLPKQYKYIMGVDIGYRDADAIAIMAWSEDSPTTYLIEEVLTTKQDITSLAQKIEELRKKYGVYKIVMDAGALGKKVHEELTRRHQLPIEAADKTRKQENVEILNDALRLGHFKAKSGSRFAQDSYLIQIDWDKSTPDKIVIKKNPHSDIIDAVLYAFKLSPAYAYKPELPKHKVGSHEWSKQQEEDMFTKTLESMLEKQENDEFVTNFGIK